MLFGFHPVQKKGFSKNLNLWDKKLLVPLDPAQSSITEGTHAAYVLKILVNTSSTSFDNKNIGLPFV